MKRHVRAKAGTGKLFKTVLPAAAVLIAGIFAIPGLMVYKITHPGAVPEPVDPSHYLLPSQDAMIPCGKNREIPGWWIPGLRGAPGIILAPGYGMNRSDALSLAVVLREKGFNLLIYDQRGSGISPRGASTLGLHEADDMSQAIHYLKSRPESDPSRLGIWGTDVAARGALKAAAAVPEVRVLAADGAFEFAPDFLDLRIREEFGLHNRLLQAGCGQIFRLIHTGRGSSWDEPIPVQALSDRTILFIRGENLRELGRLTADLHGKIRPQKEMVSLKAARVHLMSGENLRSYDRQVANFFHSNLR